MTDDRKQTKCLTSCRTFLRRLLDVCDVTRAMILAHRRDLGHAGCDGDHEKKYMLRDFLRAAEARLYIENTYSAA